MFSGCSKSRLFQYAGSLSIFVTCAVCSNEASAQACCAATSAITPGRLVTHEAALVGMRSGGVAGLGSYDRGSEFIPNEDGAGQVDVPFELFSTLRIVRRLQVGVVVPTLVTLRWTERERESSFGLSDVSAHLRFDASFNREYRYLPGIAFLLGATFPTGRSAEKATKPLASDATGLGVFQPNAGLWVERSFGSWLLTVAGLVTLRTAKEESGVKSQLAPLFTVVLALGYSLSENWAIALTETYLAEGTARIDSNPVPGTSRYKWRSALSASGSISDHLRLQMGTIFDPPFDGIGKNELSHVGGNLSVIWSFL